MFADEKAEWDKFYNFFKKEFNEEVGFMLGVFESDDYEIDLIVGEDSGDIHGVRIMQAIPYEDEEEDTEGDAEIAEIKTREDDEGDEGDEGEEEDEDAMVEMIQYDFVKKPIAEAEIEGKPYFQLQFGNPDKTEDEEATKETTPTEDEETKEKDDNDDGSWFKLVIYSKQAEGEEIELTGAVMVNGENPEEVTVFVEHPDLG